MTTKIPRYIAFLTLAGWISIPAEPAGAPQPGRITFARDAVSDILRVLIDGKEAFVYCYGANLDLVHYYPVRSPSGRSLTVQYPEQFPHHRSFWFADRVQLAGKRQVGFYNAHYTRTKPDDLKSPCKDRVRHVKFLASEAKEARARLETQLVWEMDLGEPVLDEVRKMRIVALGGGEYFLDVVFTLTASHGDVSFTSDAVHYAWPYIRMNTESSVAGGGTITSSAGGINQAGTNGKVARWVDYTNTVKGTTEGLAIFSHTENDHPHQWLTRDYGCFGPRRADQKSGKKFTLEKGQSIRQRVGVLVHRGDVKSGRVAERYSQYVEGKL